MNTASAADTAASPTHEAETADASAQPNGTAPSPNPALAMNELLSTLRDTVGRLRQSGLDDQAIASIAGLDITSAEQ